MRTRCGQDAESNFVNPHSFRNLSAYSWTCPQPVLIPSELLPRTLLQSIQREQWFLHLSADRMPKWHNLLPQPILILSRALVDVRHYGTAVREGVIVADSTSYYVYFNMAALVRHGLNPCVRASLCDVLTSTPYNRWTCIAVAMWRKYHHTFYTFSNKLLH